LLFSDNFVRAELGEKWGTVVPTFTLEKGALKGTQTRFDAPAIAGKAPIKGHNAVIGTDVPTKPKFLASALKGLWNRGFPQKALQNPHACEGRRERGWIRPVESGAEKRASKLL